MFPKLGRWYSAFWLVESAKLCLRYMYYIQSMYQASYVLHTYACSRLIKFSVFFWYACILYIRKHKKVTAHRRAQAQRRSSLVCNNWCQKNTAFFTKGFANRLVFRIFFVILLQFCLKRNPVLSDGALINFPDI